MSYRFQRMEGSQRLERTSEVLKQTWSGMMYEVSLLCEKTLEINNIEGGRICLGSWIQRFQLRVTGPCCLW